MTKNKSVFSGWFQLNIINNFKIFRKPFKITNEFFEELHTKHYSSEFTFKYNENLFVDQDKNSGQALINEILLNQAHFGYLSNELRVLKEWIEDFKKEYTNLKSLLKIEKIELNQNSKQFVQLEFLLKTCKKLLSKIESNERIIDSEKLTLPIQLNLIDNTNLKVSEGFNFQRLKEYGQEHRFIEYEPTDSFSVVIVFRRLSEIVNQIAIVNGLINQQKSNQLKFIHGNAGMGKSNFSAFIYNELTKKEKPAIIISGKSFSGDPDSFDKIFMNNLLIPDNYRIEEVLKKLNKYAKKNNTRVSLIFDGLNETSYANEGFSQMWIKSLDSFVETLKSFPHLYLVATLRTSYIPRIWADNNLPYEQIELKGFDGSKLNELIQKYFIDYKINTDILIESDKFFFKTPLFLDLYCQMLNGDKANMVDPLLGLEGFTQVFDMYVSNLSNKTFQKLNLPTVDQVSDGIALVSQAMLDEIKAYVPKMEFFEKMQGRFIDNIVGSIGYEILQEYLIYLDENKDNRDVVVHTQEEVGGYLLANRLIETYDNVDAIVNSEFFQNFILGNSGSYHKLKDDILKFLIAKSEASSLLFTDYISLDVVKKFTLLNLQRSKQSDKYQEFVSLLKEAEFSIKEIRTLINDTSITFYDLDSNINFLFIRDVLTKLSNYNLDFTWTFHIYNNHYDYNEFLLYFIKNSDELEGNEKDSIIIELVIWLNETTIRDLRDKSTRFLLRYFSNYPDLLLGYIKEYSDSNSFYIKERLALVCYGVCLRLQNDKSFVDNHLGELGSVLYDLQFAEDPEKPTYNYIVIDSYKHIIDLSILKGVFELDKKSLARLREYHFVKNDWFEIDDQDRELVASTSQWHLSPNPDPLAGDFVHYTIPRLDNLNHESRLENTANIYKEILRLGYVSEEEGLSKREYSFYKGSNIIGVNKKIDRLGKKYSWMAYFNYAGYLLSQNKLGVWSNYGGYDKYYERLSDTEIEPSYDVHVKIDNKVIETNFFINRKPGDNTWISETNYDILSSLYNKDEYTLLSAFIDQKLDEQYNTRSWIQANSYFVNKDQVLEFIDQIENREFDWKFELHGGESISNVYFGELYWADTIPVAHKSNHNIPLTTVNEEVKEPSVFDTLMSQRYNREDIEIDTDETVYENCNFDYQATLMDFLWETDSKEITSLRCDIPAVNLGKHLDLTVDSARTKILDSNLSECFKEYYSEYGLNSENFHYFRTDLLEKYLKETNQLLMYQLKQHTYDQTTNSPSGHFRGMQFVFSILNR